jgi:hypothetical protein
MPKRRLAEKINRFNKPYRPPWPTSAVRAAFNALGRDPHNADDYKLVLTILAEEVFGRRRGRPSIPGYELIYLLDDYEKAKTQWPDKSESDICRKMQHPKMFCGRYSEVKPEAMRKRLQAARRVSKERIIEDWYERVVWGALDDEEGTGE